MLEISPPEVGEMSLNKMMAGSLFLIFLAASLIGQTREVVAGEALLRQLEADFAADVAKHGHDAFITHFADDGVEVVDGGGFNDKDAMRKQPPWPEGTTLTWAPIKAEMAASGDLGYTYGTYIYTAKNKEGKLVTSYGKYTSIWKKQKNGQWKVVVDVGNSSPDPNLGK
jgi:ketosteroid isomerase-like protein